MRNSQTAQRVKCNGMFAKKKKGMVNPSCDVPQECEVIAIEERGFQEMIPIQTPRCSEVNKTKRGLSREERCIPKDIEGSQVEEKGSYSCTSERDSSSGKVPRETLLVVELDVVCVKGGFSAREKVQCFCPTAVDLPGRNTDLGYHIQGGGEINRLPRTSEKVTTGLGFEAEGEDDTLVGRSVRPEGEGLGKADGTRPVSSGKVWQSHSKTQEEKQPGPGQAYGSDRGSGPILELGRAHGWLPGLGLDYRVALSPVSTNRPLLHGSDLSAPSCFKAQDSGLEVGLRQGLPSRSVMTSYCKSPISSSLNAGHEGNALHNGEEDELREVPVQEDCRDQ